MAIRKTGTCDKCNKDLYGDEYGACGHACLTIVGDELAETKYKLETAVKGLKNVKEILEPIASYTTRGTSAYLRIDKCLKDLGEE